MGTDSHLSRDWGLAATRVLALFGSSCASFVTYRLWHSYCVPMCPWELRQETYTLSVGHNQEGPLAPGWQEKTLLTCPTQLKSWYSSILPFFEVYSRKKLDSDAILLNTPKFFILCLWSLLLFFWVVILRCSNGLFSKISEQDDQRTFLIHLKVLKGQVSSLALLSTPASQASHDLLQGPPRSISLTSPTKFSIQATTSIPGTTSTDPV